MWLAPVITMAAPSTADAPMTNIRRAAAQVSLQPRRKLMRALRQRSHQTNHRARKRWRRKSQIRYRRKHQAARSSLTAPRHSPAVRRAGLCRQGRPRAQRAKSPSCLHLWQKRGVFISGRSAVSSMFKRELRRRSAIEPIIGHLKAEGHLGPPTSKAARRRCRQRRFLSRGPQLPPHPRLAASSLAPYPGGSHRTHQRPVGPQISFLTDDQIWTRFNPTGGLLTDLSLEVGRRLKYLDAMRYFFHIFDGSKLFPDDAGNNLPSLEYAKQMAEVVADELKKGGEFYRSSSGDRLGRERQKALRVRRFLSDSPVE